METADGLMIVSSDTPEVETPPPGTPETPPGAPAPAEPGPPADSPPAPEAAPDDDDGAVSPRELKRLVGRMTRRNADMERELSATRAKVETLTRLIQPAPAQTPPEPDGPPRRPRMGDYGSEEDYQAAEERYITDMVDWRAAEREANVRVQQQSQSQAEQYAQTMAQVRTREAEILQTVPDYYERFERIGPTMSPAVLEALKLSGARGPDLVLHLAAHPEEIQRLNQTPTFQVPAELGLLLGQTARSAAPPPAEPRGAQTNAPRLPEPPQPISGGGGQVSSVYSDQMTQEQFDAWARRTYPNMSYTWRR